MTRKNDNEGEGRSVLASLRSMAPDRRLRFSEALRIAEWQATRLLELMQIADAAVPSEIVTELPRVRVRYMDLPTSGMTFWEDGTWVICLNRHEPATRQRFTLFHEFKHIIDHGRTHQLYRGQAGATPERQAEQAADYFAGCALMPRRLLKREWGRSLQDVNALARHFDVSPRAMDVRLAQVGLNDPLPRCKVELRPKRRSYPGLYHRQMSATWSATAYTKESSHA